MIQRDCKRNLKRPSCAKMTMSYLKVYPYKLCLIKHEWGYQYFYFLLFIFICGFSAKVHFLLISNNEEMIRIKNFSTQKNDVIFILEQIKVSVGSSGIRSWLRSLHGGSLEITLKITSTKYYYLDIWLETWKCILNEIICFYVGCTAFVNKIALK